MDNIIEVMSKKAERARETKHKKLKVLKHLIPKLGPDYIIRGDEAPNARGFVLYRMVEGELLTVVQGSYTKIMTYLMEKLPEV